METMIMATTGETIKEIHRLRSYRKELDQRLKQGPKAHKAHQLKIAQAEEAVKKSHDGIKHLKVTILEKESAIKTQHASIEKLEKTSVTNKKEYDALRAEVATAREHIRKLEDEQLEAMGELEEKTKAGPESDKLLEKVKK